VCVAPSAARRVEIGDIFRRYGPAYRARNRLHLRQRRAMRAIERCRTPAMGGHLQACDHCDAMVVRFHSCRDRHCPKCQTLAKERWVEARRSELLATPYYHLVFTLPHVLNPLIQGNPRCLYNLLFKAASETLLTFGRDPKWIGGEIGVTLVLHTWGQNLGDHVHVHGLVTGGGLAPDGQRWLKARNRKFLFPVAALSEVFKAKYLELLIKARKSGALRFGGKTEELADDPAFAAFVAELRGTYWTVYAKAPFAGPEKLIDYLGRYTHRAAISNERLIGLDNGQVLFRWRDYRDKSRMKTMALDADEFIRRFLLHILPSGFMRVRHYGLFANRHRKTKLARCRAALDQPEPEPRPEPSVEDLMQQLTGRDILACTECGKGRLRLITVLKPSSQPWPTGPP
jgi:hypothetical protein